MREIVAAGAVLLSVTSAVEAACGAKLSSPFDTISSKVAAVVAPGADVAVRVLQGQAPGSAVADNIATQIQVAVLAGDFVSSIDQAAEDIIKQAVGGDAAKLIEILRLPSKIQSATALQTIAVPGEIADNKK